MAVNSYYTFARDALARAEKALNEAERAYPNMPLIGDLYTKEGTLDFNIMPGNTCTDKNRKQIIGEPSNRITYGDAVLESISLKIKEQLEKCEADLDKTSKDVKRLAAEHFMARTIIVQNIIESST